MGGDQAVGERGRGHVEVAEGDDEVAALGGAAHEFGDFPGLGRSVADVGVVRFPLVRRVQVGGEDFRHIVRGGSDPDSCTSNALAHEPVAPEKGRGPAIEWVADHAALFDWPSG